MALIVLLAASSAASASPQSRELTQKGFSRAYALEFPESMSLFEQARAADRVDPAPVRAAAAVTWMQILFGQGVATFEAFTGEASEDSVQRPPVDPTLAARFIGNVTEAIELSERRIRADRTDVDAQYQLGASTGLLALYRATVEGRTWAAFVEGRRAVRTMERVRERQRDHREAALILGMYRYAVSTLSWPKRMLANAAGMPGDREGGIELLELAASPSATTATDASLLLTIAYNRERRHAGAMQHLELLQQRHPGNRLIVLNIAATALAASDPARAADVTTAVLTTTPPFDQSPWASVRCGSTSGEPLAPRSAILAQPGTCRGRWQAGRAIGFGRVPVWSWRSSPFRPATRPASGRTWMRPSNMAARPAIECPLTRHDA